MASREESNKPQCKTNIHTDRETNCITVYKKLEHVLNNKNEQFPKKAETLIEAWRQVCLYSHSDKIPYVGELMNWAKYHTLNIVLHGDWKKYKDTYEQKLLFEVEQTQNVLENLNNVFSLRCKKLAEVIRDPWGNSILYRLLNTPEITIGPEEIEFFCIETGYLVSHRLKKLCESHCEDLALNLVTAFIKCYKLAETWQFNLNATTEQRWFIFDVYIALLFKFKKFNLIVAALKSLPLKDGYELVKRFMNKRVKISKVWRHSGKIAQMACQVYVASTCTRPLEPDETFLKDLLKIWFIQNQSDECLDSLTAALRRVVIAAVSASHLYTFCEAIYEEFGVKMKTFTIELYIRALTTDMNILERQKNEKEMDKAAETTKRLAAGFCRLADILEEHVKVSRECVLTSFSLEPTKERLKRIENMARLCGYTVLDTGQDWKCSLHPPVLPSDELCWICNLCGDYMSQPQIEAAINTNTALFEALTGEQLGLSRQLCDDLAVVLSSPRYQVLSWLLRWEDLHRLCVMYLNDPERTKNMVTELKFVDIDYSMFMGIKREPEDEDTVTGIERGYEHYLETDFFTDEEETALSEDSASQDSRPYSLGSDGAGESPSCFLPQPKSDPDVLKSLRMFRPNLKRTRSSLVEDKPPDKISKRGRMDDATNSSVGDAATKSYHGSLYVKLYNDYYTAHKQNGISLAKPLPRTPEPPQEQPINLVQRIEDKEPDKPKENIPKPSSLLSALLAAKPQVPIENKSSMIVSFDEFEKFSNKMNNPQTSSTVTMKEAKVLLNRINVKQYINKKLKEKERKLGTSMVPRVLLNRNDVNVAQFQAKSKDTVAKNDEATPRTSISNTPPKNKTAYPCVLLERLDTNKKLVRSILANVPGLNDLELIRPSTVDHIVQVVQIAGGRQNTTVPTQHTQTSTQVSPHIQRVGQPRNDKPEQTSDTGTPSSTANPTMPPTTKPVTSQSSTLINILSQQIIRPGQSNCTRSRTSPLINILSQQIIRPGSNAVSTPKTTTSSTATAPDGIQRSLAAGEQQVLGQLTNPVTRNAASAIKTVVGSSATDQNRIVQFICKSTDGKLIPVTSFAPSRVVKVATTTQTVSSTTSPVSPSFEETKLNKSGQKQKPEGSENSEMLPKFQQAFGKSVYQNNMDTGSNSSISTDMTTNSDDPDKKVPKTTAVNVQPIHGGVIYTRQMPVGQTINLIPPGGRGQVFRIAASNSEHTVIHSKMSALLAAALQGKQKASDFEIDSSSSEDSSGQRITVSKSTLVQNAKIVKPVLHIPTNVIGKSTSQPNLSSTTLEQLREFDMVYKQVKERSSTNVGAESVVATETNDSSQQRIVTYMNQGQKYTQLSPVVVVSSYCNVQPAASPALSVTSQGSSSPCVTPAPTPTLPKVSSSSSQAVGGGKNSKMKAVKNTTTNTSKASPIPKPQQKPQEDEHTTQRIFDILAEYAEQLRNSPDLNNKPAPRRRSNPPTNPNQNSKRKKSANAKKSGQCSSTLSSDADIEDPRTVGSEDSSCGVVQISMQDEEQSQTTAHTSESNDATVASCQQLILTDSSHNQTRNLIIADSTVGEALKLPNTAVLVPGNYIMPVSMVKGGQQIAVVSGASKLLTVPARSGSNMLLLQSFINQTRKTPIPTVKYSAIQPLPGGIPSQTLTGVSAQPPVVLPPTTHGLPTVALGQPITLKKLNETDPVNTELLLTISQPQYGNQVPDKEQQHPDGGIVIDQANTEQTLTQIDAAEKIYATQKSLIATPIATPVISQVSKEDLTDEQHMAAQTIIALSAECSKGEMAKAERVQSVLVTTCTSNGPMLSHSPPNYGKAELATTAADQPKEFLRATEKPTNTEQKHFQPNTVYYQKIKKPIPGTHRLDRELHQLSLQRKQAALERELRLQKSLSEECEDLGVDEPSTSDLFPEADLLFDSNHSPSFEQTSQEIKRPILQETKAETKPTLTLFSDDDNSGSLRTDFLFETVEYQTPATELYGHGQPLANGQGSASNESASSSCEDNTLLQNCGSISDVTLNSPMTPDAYADNSTPPSLNKYKYKYSNKKKNDRSKPSEPWPAEVSSSEDTTGSTELVKSSSPELCSKRCEEESSYKVVRVAISKGDFLKDEEGCDELHCDDDVDSSVSGRGARRSVKKLCSCCNGSQDAAGSRKRPASRPHTPAPHKKAFPSKKR